MSVLDGVAKSGWHAQRLREGRELSTESKSFENSERATPQVKQRSHRDGARNIPRNPPAPADLRE